MRRRHLFVCTAALFAGPAWPLGAAAPFQPPAAVLPAAALPADAAGSAAAAAAPPGLTGIRLGAKPQALIDGRWLASGASVRGARLAVLDADTVQLRHGDGRIEKLSLTPQVELRPRTPPPGKP